MFRDHHLSPNFFPANLIPSIMKKPPQLIKAKYIPKSDIFGLWSRSLENAFAAGTKFAGKKSGLRWFGSIFAGCSGKYLKIPHRVPAPKSTWFVKILTLEWVLSARGGFSCKN